MNPNTPQDSLTVQIYETLEWNFDLFPLPICFNAREEQQALFQRSERIRRLSETIAESLKGQPSSTPSPKPMVRQSVGLRSSAFVRWLLYTPNIYQLTGQFETKEWSLNGAKYTTEEMYTLFSSVSPSPIDDYDAASERLRENTEDVYDFLPTTPSPEPALPRNIPDGESDWLIGSENFSRQEVFKMLFTQRAMIENDLKRSCWDALPEIAKEIVIKPRTPNF